VGSCWLLRYRETVLVGGQPVVKQVAKKLATYSDKYRTEQSVRPLAEEILAPINAGTARPTSADTVDAFLKTYLVYVKENKRASTTKAYNDFYKLVKPYLNGLTLREFHTSDADRLLRAVATNKPRAHTSLMNVKNFLSGAFRYAVRTDAVDRNTVREAVVPAGKPAGETHAYTLDEIQNMLAVLGEPARTVVLTCALTGMRMSEVKGLRWEDFTGSELRVCRAVWQGKVTETKTEASAAAVPVLAIVADALNEHRARTTGGGYIFHGATGQPLRLENLLRNVILPALDTADPKIEWHGWHAFRRGLATNLYSLGAPDKTVQAILRHANVSTTMAYYVKPVAGASQAAMKKLEKAFKKAEKRTA
jgi:integrase